MGLSGYGVEQTQKCYVDYLSMGLMNLLDFMSSRLSVYLLKALD